MITDKDIEKMKGVFATAQDHVNLEKKVDTVAEAVNGVVDTVHTLAGTVSSVSGRVDRLTERVDGIIQRVEKLPTRDEIQEMLERTFNLATLKAEHERMKTIIREHLHVEV